jgi:ariadne-1
MASGGGAVSNKRYRQVSSCTGHDDDSCGTSRRGKTCEAAPRSGRDHDDDGESADGDGSRGHAQETADDGSSSGDEDYMFEYDDDDDDDCEGGAEQTQADAAACDGEQRYAVLTEDDVRARQEADTARVAEVLSIPPGFAAVLLRHFKWRVGRVQEEWFADERRVRGAAGLPPGQLVPAARGLRPRVCAICFDEQPAGQTASAGCSHYYCNGCWRGYVRAAVGDGPRCLSLRCPDPRCSAPVVRELVDEVLAADDVGRYARFWLRSYVEESGGRVRWCGGPGCARALESSGGGDAAADVFCVCGYGVCWACGEEAHRPVSCATVRAWLLKNSSDSAETANWVMAHTKPCPRCGRPIEKNQGCNHMRCSPPCGHRFCWLCLQPAGGENHYACNDLRPHPPAETGVAGAGAEEKEARRLARASLERYLYHYERWVSNRAALESVARDTATLERGELEWMARAADVPATELGFVAEAYRQVAEGRRILRWAHAYGYFLDPERDVTKRGLFDDLQNQANRWLECLHASAELERKELFGSGGETAPVDGEAFRAYRQKVANLTGVTRKFIGNLVRAFETDLSEVVAVIPAN